MRFLKKYFGTRSTTSRSVAKERLQLVLVHDRTQLSPQLLQTLKDEIIAVISKHVSIDRDAVDISFTQTGRESRLQADIPLRAAARKRAAN
jgi:cell division topological specificity factor